MTDPVHDKVLIGRVHKDRFWEVRVVPEGCWDRVTHVPKPPHTLRRRVSDYVGNSGSSQIPKRAIRTQLDKDFMSYAPQWYIPLVLFIVLCTLLTIPHLLGK